MAGKNIFRPDEPARSRGGSWLLTALFVGALGSALAWMIYTQFRVDVPTGHMAIMIHKAGKDISNDEEVAPGTMDSPEFKGVQRWYHTEGRYFYNPMNWDWRVIEQKSIKDGELGILTSLTGDDLPYGDFLAKIDADGHPTTKGIVPGVLRPGRHPIHPYLFSLEIRSPITVPGGFKGVVTNLAGPLATDPNKLLVPNGFRGVQEESLEPGTYYVNPYETRISLVDCRSQRFNLAENHDMGFPSKDGFWVSLDGVVEFRVRPEKAAEVYVIYNEFKNPYNQDREFDPIDEEIIRKVIMPNARSFCRLKGSNELGREFIQGESRSLFQEHFQQEMHHACDPLGIEIIQALITRIYPPQKIAGPVRDREIAKQQEKQYQQQILQQTSEKDLAMELELVKQKEALVKAEQEVVKLTIEAKREQEVAVTKAEEKKSVAQFKLDAAKDEAAAIGSKGKAEAEVVRFQNEADAAGWKQSVLAFGGDGALFSRYVLLLKLAPSYQRIMANTADSPIMKIFEGFTSNPANPSSRPNAQTASQSPDESRETE